MLQYLLPKKALSSLAGYLAVIKRPSIKNAFIHYFINKYGVDLSEAREENPTNYLDFNDFFIRQLKPECRPISSLDITSPVDGSISELGHIEQGTLIQAKGHYYSTDELLGFEEGMKDLFNTGLFATLYLSPKDYHRVHMPIQGTLKRMVYIPGQLFSVQPATARHIPRLFARNERLVVYFDTAVGLMAMVLVGATIVGTIGTHWHGDIKRQRKKSHFDYDNSTVYNKADEMGYFKLGSTVILLFADSTRVQWKDDLKATDKIKFGEGLGHIKH